MNSKYGEIKKHYKELDVLRVFAMILVVISHSAYLLISSKYGGIDYITIVESNGMAIASSNRFLNFGREVIYSFHMPLFIFLSGLLFFKKSEKYDSFTKLLKEKTLRLLVPFVAVTLLYSVPLKLCSGYYDLSLGFLQVFRQIILGQLLLLGNSHLWYLWALFVDFLISWVINEKLKDNKTLVTIKWILIVACYACSYLEISEYLIISQPLRYLLHFNIGVE